MSVFCIGDFKIDLLILSYKGHRIVCNIKVWPTPVTLFEREPINDYHWMTAGHWARIESALFRIFENLDHWGDAKKLRTEVLVNHINIRLQATEKDNYLTRILMGGAELGPEDISLDIQLQHMEGEDTTILGLHATKPKVDTKAKANGIAKKRSASSSRSKPATVGSGAKPKAGIQEKPSRSKPKHIDADDEEDDDCPAASGSKPPAKVKRGRRSISQGADMQPENSPNNGRSSPQGKRRSISTSGRNSRGSSTELKATRRSGRSPICPSRYNNFVLSHTQQRKSRSGGGKPKAKPSPVKKVKKKPVTPSTPSPAQALREKSLTPTPAEELKVEQMDGARLDALQRLDSMLAISKPPEVQILLLENMGEDDVLATYERYRGDFDRLFKERKNKAHTHSYMNVSHMDVMDILSKEIRNRMMKKLAESYSTQSSHTSLLINGLLPLWIVLLFTDTYKLSHGDAVRQIKDQLRWSSYLKALNNDPLSSDMED